MEECSSFEMEYLSLRRQMIYSKLFDWFISISFTDLKRGHVINNFLLMQGQQEPSF